MSWLALDKLEETQRKPQKIPYSIPVIDLAGRPELQVVVERDPEHYLGHPTTCLLEDGKTILCVYPQGHGQGPIIYKKSVDGGLTWSERLPTPASWQTSKETPTIHRVVNAAGWRRLILWSGLYPARLAISEDDGKTWGELKPAGDWGGIVVMSSLIPLRTGPGHYLAMFHDDGRYFSNSSKQTNPPTFTLYKTFSRDGGLTWSFPEPIWEGQEIHLCEPGLVRSPDGKKLAALLRENRRVANSQVIFSIDEGKTWSAPSSLPAALTGDRHVAKYLPDGRLLVVFRDMTEGSPTWGDWVGWIGRFEDLEKGTEGRFRVRFMDNHQDGDCGYAGLEILPDGTIVTVSYGHWVEGHPPFIVCVRISAKELGRLPKVEAGRIKDIDHSYLLER
ncbi:MAG: glycoside hydrolase [Candidatus Saccharicenans sp.]|nr:glycoside hydrolase [Candidatus Saccharicenans sp.]